MHRILTLLLIFYSTFGHSQATIEGIGKLKLKKTTIADLNSFVDKQVNRREGDNLQYQIDKFAFIKEIHSDTIDLYNFSNYGNYCKQVQVFCIPKMTISNIIITDTYLTFYKDTLVEINTDYESELVEAFELKYGKPNVEKIENPVKCTVKLTGATITYTEQTFYSRWQNGNIQCTVTIGNYYDNKCEKKILSYITISIPKVHEIISACNDKEENRIRDKQKLEKKKQLRDF